MALKGSMKPGRSREKRGAARSFLFRHRPAGSAVEPILAPEDDPRSYVELTFNPDGSLATDPDTVPRP